MSSENDKHFFFKGKFFDNKEDFAKYVQEWPFLEMDYENFNREWESLGNSLYMSLAGNNIKLTNGALNEALEVQLMFLFDMFVRKSGLEVGSEDVR